MKYSYAIERSAAQVVFDASPQERRLLRLALERLAATPSAQADLVERDKHGRELFTRFFGPFTITYWIDHAVAEIRVVCIYRD